MTAQASPPLHGIRVLDLSRILAGPYCTMHLADLGAEVIKVEEPGNGDQTRDMKPPEAGGEAHFYLSLNRNKQDVALDLKGEAGREVLHRLAGKCDLLVENFRPGVMKRLGLDYAAMHKRHPHLIYCSISAYGQEGLMSDRPGYDPIIQAEMGLMAMTGEPEGQPMRHPLPLTDLFTGLYMTSAVLAALLARQATGHGQHVEVSLMGAAMGALTNFGQYYLTGGKEPPRMGNNHPVAVPVGLFHASDGMFYMAAATNRQFSTVCNDVLNRPDLPEDPRFCTNSARTQNKEALFPLLEEEFGRDTLGNWLGKMRQAGVPAGAVRGMAEALESPEVADSGQLVEVEHPTAGTIRLVGSPYRFSETPVAPPVAPPLLGQHTEQVLRGLLEMDDAGIATLRAEGAIP